MIVLVLLKKMRQATSLYTGNLVEATQCDYQDYKELGLHCPLCGEAVFLNKGSDRVVPHFKHYRHSGSEETICEARCLTKEGKERLELFSGVARSQRLELFVDRFWQIYSEGKDLDMPLIKRILAAPGFDSSLREIKRHWNKERLAEKAYLKGLGDRFVRTNHVSDCLDKLKVRKDFNKEIAKEITAHLKAVFKNPLNLVIAREVIFWIPTCDRAFRLVLAVIVSDVQGLAEDGYLDGYQIISTMVLSFLITDWETNIGIVAVQPQKTRGKGFKK